VLHKVSSALPPQIAVMFNPLGAGFRWAVEVPNTQPGDTVVILGPGQRGLASVIACRAAGGGTVEARTQILNLTRSQAVVRIDMFNGERRCAMAQGTVTIRSPR